MKTVIACLLASTQAVRFIEPEGQLSKSDDESLVRPVMRANNITINANRASDQSFSQALKHDKQPDIPSFRETTFSKRPVIQPFDDTISVEQKRELMAMENNSMKLNYHTPQPDPEPVKEKPKSKAQVDYEKEAHSQMFAKYIDEKDMDQYVDSNSMKVLGISEADDTSNVQLSKLPYVDDVGRRAYHDSHEQYEWYPGDRRVYTDIEERFDFAQKSHPGVTFVQQSLPDVGTRDFSVGHELHAWYPGDRRYYPYEAQFDHAQISKPALAQLPDVGSRDFSAPHSDHLWYPGDRKYYDFESKFDHHQMQAAPRY